jgi:hypothetical protein
MLVRAPVRGGSRGIHAPESQPRIERASAPGLILAPSFPRSLPLSSPLTVAKNAKKAS